MADHDEQWFIDRIGKRIYRQNDNGCTCGHCARVLREGLVICDETHADYLYDVQLEMGSQYEDQPAARPPGEEG